VPSSATPISDPEHLGRRIVKQSANKKGLATGVTDQQKRDMVRYLEAGLAVHRKRDDLLRELAEAFGKSNRQIERYVETIGRQTQRRVAGAREKHNRELAWIAGILRDNAAKLLNFSGTPANLGGIIEDYAIVGAIRRMTYIIGIGSLNPLIDYFAPEKVWYVDAPAAVCLLAHLNQEFPEIKVDDWWAVKKENITPELMDALQSLAERQSFAPAAGCLECRAIEAVAHA